jgi:hypothetical protein
MFYRVHHILFYTLTYPFVDIRGVGSLLNLNIAPLTSPPVHNNH